ncbi:MAG: phage/plasmid primase, P4 family [Leucobacter sp.]
MARILVSLHGVRRLLASRDPDARPSKLDPVVVWDPAVGIYSPNLEHVLALAGQYNSSGGASFMKDVDSVVRRLAPRIGRETSTKWAPVANGDYERGTGVLHPFSPDRVFLSRSPVAYVADAQNPVIRNDVDGTDWDVDSGLMEIADGDEEVYGQLWEVLASVAQPHIRTNKAVALYDTAGNNGKGTVVALATALAGESRTLAASLANLAKDTTLPLISGKSLIVSDENATNDFVRNAEVVKSLATRDPILVNPKYEKPYNEVFEGAQVHCMNALPKFGDRGGSMWRRWLLIPLSARFEGRERKYIKDDYIHRPEVLQYVLRRALEMDFTGYSETSASASLLAEAKVENDPVRLFWAEHRDEFVWDLLPLEFIFEVYKGWFSRDKPSGRMVDRKSFDDSIREAVADDPGDWVDLGRGEKMKASTRMVQREPLVVEYQHRNVFEMPEKWTREFPKGMQFRNVLYRDRVTALTAAASSTAAAPVSPAAVPAQAPVSSADPAVAHLARCERLAADEQALWEQRAVEEGVTDPAHVTDHARITRMGSACGCGAAPQRAYDPAEFARAESVALAVSAARADLDELLSPS